MEGSVLETGDGAIIERFRHLKAAAVRAGLGMGRRSNRNVVETGASFVGPVADRNVNRGMSGGLEGGGFEHSIGQRGKGCKRKSSCLVAMALGMSSDVRTVQGSSGNFYDYSARESSLDSLITIPPRPKAQRVESGRQQVVALAVSHIHVPVSEALRHLRTSNSSTSTVGENLPVEREGFQVSRRSAFTRVLPENAITPPHIFPVLADAERLLDALETYFNNGQL
ncbi:OLC1v1015895C1 [Oldenlandia corymbosa var. corymbosa]|uniref:OLC1v1015895C1 n=1 Tax=Oldenlandia corymbosa var. corymbosa TaxID=529605 RepID=A0AAV1E4J2_OLDCO|nr:OLC1v1015895C1 [Oldenlandia corymbosa var. corymbosa]